MSFVHEMYENTQLNYTKCSWQTCTSLHIKPISGDVSIFSIGHTTHKPISLHTNLYQGMSLNFPVTTLPTNIYPYIQTSSWGCLYIFQWPHCPQAYITTNNTSIKGVFIFSGGQTAHKLISLHTTLISLHKTPLSRGSLYFLVATLPTNLYHSIQHLYHYIQHLYQGGLYFFWWPHCPQTYITTYNTYITT